MGGGGGGEGGGVGGGWGGGGGGGGEGGGGGGRGSGTKYAARDVTFIGFWRVFGPAREPAPMPGGPGSAREAAGACGCLASLGRPGQCEVILHHHFTSHAVPGIHKVPFRVFRVDENQIDIAVFAQFKGLAGAGRNDQDFGVMAGFEEWDELVQQP